MDAGSHVIKVYVLFTIHVDDLMVVERKKRPECCDKSSKCQWMNSQKNKNKAPENKFEQLKTTKCLRYSFFPCKRGRGNSSSFN